VGAQLRQQQDQARSLGQLFKPATEIERLAAAALGYEYWQDFAAARTRWSELIARYKKDLSQGPWVFLARKKEEDLKKKASDDIKEDKVRADLVEHAVKKLGEAAKENEAGTLLTRHRLEARGACQEIISLYENYSDPPELVPLVTQAKEILGKLAKDEK
jgi:hypothetical protein